MFKTTKEDIVFVIASTIIWLGSIGVTIWDFITNKGMAYRFNTVNIAGMLLFVIGVTLRIIGRLTLGRYYSYGLIIKPDHKLVTHGIYRYVRHPITLAGIIYSIAIPLTFSSLYGFLCMLLLVPLFLYRIRIEEKMLLDYFGEEYREYMKRTKKMIPYIY